VKDNQGYVSGSFRNGEPLKSVSETLKSRYRNRVPEGDKVRLERLRMRWVSASGRAGFVTIHFHSIRVVKRSYAELLNFVKWRNEIPAGS
jgi:hypothetical protein